MEKNMDEALKAEYPSADTQLAAELFSQLPESAQDEIIDLIKSLLSAG